MTDVPLEGKAVLSLGWVPEGAVPVYDEDGEFIYFQWTLDLDAS